MQRKARMDPTILHRRLQANQTTNETTHTTDR
jgi:hypothetical protein